MAGIVAVIGILSSAGVWLLGNTVWIDTNVGSAAGNTLFPWLWVPLVAHLIVLLLGRTSRRGAKVFGALAAIIPIGLVSTMALHDWSRDRYLLDLATAHSGLQVEIIESYSIQPSLYVAIFAAGVSAVALLVSNWIPAKAAANVNQLSGTHTAKGADDPRSLWDDQSD